MRKRGRQDVRRFIRGVSRLVEGEMRGAFRLLADHPPRALNAFACGASSGASLLFFFDPRSGRRRRHELRDRTAHLVRVGARRIASRGRDAIARLHGLVHRLPRMVASTVNGREDIARDPVPPALLGELLVGAYLSVTGLVGKRRRHLVRPATREVDLVRATFGLALAARAAIDANLLDGRALREMAGRALGPVTVHKSITLFAAADDVYALLRDLGDYPRFMRHVRRVDTMAEGRARFVVDGPLGLPIACEGRVTRAVPGRVLAWESAVHAAGSTSTGAIRTSGTFTLTPMAEARTRLDVTLTYQPPLGRVGHLVARALAVDPRRALDDDLVRLKSLLELGKATGHAGPVRKGELPGLVPPTAPTHLPPPSPPDVTREPTPPTLL